MDTTAEPADIALLACVLNGDEKGLERLLERHWRSLVEYSFSILDDWDTAEDVAEEVFVRLWERRETWGLEGSVLGLLFRIARNLCVDALRQREAHRRSEQKASVSETVPTPLERVEGMEAHALLADALARLPQRRREVFLLVRQHGLSYREAAETLEVAPQTVANHLNLALADLKEALEPILRARFDENSWWRGSRNPRVAGEIAG